MAERFFEVCVNGYWCRTKFVKQPNGSWWSTGPDNLVIDADLRECRSRVYGNRFDFKPVGL